MASDILNVLKSHYEDDPTEIQIYIDDAFGLIHAEIQEKGIEYSGYFQSKWEKSANTIINFDEEYFSNLDRRNLYVYKSALVDPEILHLLQEAYRIPSLKVPTIQDIREQIFWIEENGTQF